MTQANWNEFYMPYYLNSGVEYEYEENFWTLSIHKYCKFNEDNSFDSYKMLLRPLSDITDEEIKELCRLRIYYEDLGSPLFPDKKRTGKCLL